MSRGKVACGSLIVEVHGLHGGSGLGSWWHRSRLAPISAASAAAEAAQAHALSQTTPQNDAANLEGCTADFPMSMSMSMYVLTAVTVPGRFGGEGTRHSNPTDGPNRLH